MIKNVVVFAELRAFSLFAILGLTTAGIYFGTLALLLSVAHVEYKVSVSLGYFMGVLFNFTANKVITFKQRNLVDIHRQLLRYLVLVVVNYLLTASIVVVTVEKFGLSPYIGVVFSMAATLVSGYLLSRLWVFKRAS